MNTIHGDKKRAETHGVAISGCLSKPCAMRGGVTVTRWHSHWPTDAGSNPALATKEKKRAYMKAYREKNKQKLNDNQKLYAKKWREANKEKLREFRAANKKNQQTYNLVHYKKNKEKIKDKANEWREVNPEKFKKARRKYKTKSKRELRDWFVTQTLKQQTGIKPTKEEVRLYRKYLQLKRKQDEIKKQKCSKDKGSSKS